MLLGHPGHNDVRPIDESAESFSFDSTHRFATEGLAAGIYDGLTGNRHAHDGREHGERAVIPRAGSNLGRRTIVVDVGAGPDLRHATEFV
jgi:hypothetical protein